VENLQRSDPAGYAALQKKKAGGVLTAEEEKAAAGYSSKLSGLERGASKTAASLASAQAADELRLARLGIGRTAKSATAELQAASMSLDPEHLMHQAELEDASRNAFGADYMAENHKNPTLSGDPASAQEAIEGHHRDVLLAPASERPEFAAGQLDTRRLQCAVASGNTHGEALTSVQREAVKTKAAASLGLEAANMVSDEFGNTFVHKASLTPAQFQSLGLQRPELLLDSAVTTIRVGSDGMQETEEDFATRIGLTLLAAGSMYVDSTGAQPTVVMVDQMAAAGLGSQRNRQDSMSAMLGELDGSEGQKLLAALPTISISQTPVGQVHVKAIELLSGRGRQRYEGIREEAVVSVIQVAEDWSAGLRTEASELGAFVKTIELAVRQIEEGGSQEVFGQHTFDNDLPKIVDILERVSISVGCSDPIQEILERVANPNAKVETNFTKLDLDLAADVRKAKDKVTTGQTPKEVLSVLEKAYKEAVSKIGDVELTTQRANTHERALDRLVGGSTGTDKLPSSRSLRPGP
jgi:hypothetical protein